ncbi:MAG: hypothetical protein A3H27_10490 [Acidobacteria bacterium RIFCSPLOWO2_02_FULL_59_13]|nr:MAG: hypothetical protein A3H27_10490 [Acidobacteria bacterium RIFCSPLOWO2_02_FULL_59_13]
MNKRFHPRGFTLVEILVVLVITGFIVTILLQGLNQVFRLQDNFGAEIYRTQRGAMLADWFRQTINGLIPDYSDGGNKFRGESRQMSGLTLSPLRPENGALTPFVWRLQFDRQSGQSRLHYGAEPTDPVILAWEGDFGRFIYIDANDEAHDNWPPFLGAWPQLPKAIYLESRDRAQQFQIVALPKGPTYPLPRRKELERL